MRAGPLALVVVAVLGSASPPVWAPGAGVAGEAGADIGVTWSDLRADLENVAAAAGPITPTGPATGEGKPAVGPAGATVEVERALRGLDGADSAGAAAAAWRTIFGGGASVLEPSSAGPPLRRVAFPDAAAGARFLRKRLDQARARLAGRSGPAGAATGLHARLRHAVEVLGDLDRRPSFTGDCGPVRVEASGDTAALGQICADLGTYWPRDDPGTGRAVVRLRPVRAGGLPTLQRDTTAALSTVEPILADLLAEGGGSVAAATPAAELDAPARPQGAPRASGTMRQPLGSTPPTIDGAPVETTGSDAPGDRRDPTMTAGSGDPGGSDASRPQAWAAVLAAAHQPRLWTTATGAIAALVAGSWIFRRGREIIGSRSSWGRAR